METVTIMAARRPSRSKANPSFSGSLPGFPEVDGEEWVADSLPLPDHFPEPYEEEEKEKLGEVPEVKESSVDPPSDTAARASVTLEQGATLVFCPAPPPTRASSQKSPSSPQPQPPPTSPKPTLTCPAFPASPTSSSSPTSPTSPTTTPTSPKGPPPTSPKPSLTRPAFPTDPKFTPTTPTTPTTATSPQSAVDPSSSSSTEPEVTMRTKPPKTLPKPLVTSSTSESVMTSFSDSEVTPRNSCEVTSGSPIIIKGPESVGKEDTDSKEGVKRITDKYAVPAALMRTTSSARSSGPPPSSPSSPRNLSNNNNNNNNNNNKPASSSPSTTTTTATTTTAAASSSTDPPVARRKDSLPASPTPCITLTPCPSNGQPEVSLVTVNVSPGRIRKSRSSSTKSTASTTAADATTADAQSDSATSRGDSLVLTLPDVVGVRSSGSGHSISSVSMSAFSDMTWGDKDTTCDSSSSPFGESGVVVPVPLVPEEQGLLGTCRYQSVSGIPLTASLGDGVTDRDVQQVEMFYRSHKSEVTVCRCLANLYLGSAASKAGSSPLPTAPPATAAATTTTAAAATVNGSAGPSGSYSDLWQFITTGIPVLVLDSGRHHRRRRLLLVLAEKGTGFVLWKDDVTPLSRYSCPESQFHTLRLSSDVSKVVGLSFDDSKAAADFGVYITQLLMSEFDDDEGTLKKKKKKGRRKKKKTVAATEEKNAKYKPPKKTDISRPCCFQHVTRLERPQVTGVLPLPPNSLVRGGSLHASFRDHLSLSSRTQSCSSDLSDTLTITSEQ